MPINLLPSNKFLFIGLPLLAVWLSFCQSPPDEEVLLPSSQRLLAITTSDFSTGSISVLELDNPSQAFRQVAPIHSDAITRYNPYSKMLYVINRFGRDNIQILDPANHLKTVAEYSLASGSNPQDIGFISAKKAYVTLYNRDYLLILDTIGQKEVGRIEISSFADADGIPEAHAIYIHQGSDFNHAYISLQRLNRANLFQPTDKSLMLVVDTSLDRILGSLELQAKNPNTAIVYSPYTARIHVSSLGRFGRYYSLDGGIETIRPSSLFAEIVVEPLIISEQQIGYEINDFVITSERECYAIVSDAEYNSAFVLIRGEKTLNETALTLQILKQIKLDDGGFLSGLIIDSQSQRLFLGDRRVREPGIWVYDLVNGFFQWPAAIDVGLPPTSLTIIP